MKRNVKMFMALSLDPAKTNKVAALVVAVNLLTATLVFGTTAAYTNAIAEDHPVSFWPLDETSGVIIHDVVGTNNGSCVNPRGLGLGGPGIFPAQGDTAIYFTNASGGYISVPYSANFSTTTFSVEAWLNMPVFPATGAGANMNPLSFCNGVDVYGWTWNIAGANASNPGIDGWLGQNGSWTQVSAGVCIQGQWSYYVMTYNGTIFSVYTNGVLAGSHGSTYYLNMAGTPLLLGAYNDYGSPPDIDATRDYRGGMENVAVYNYALTPAQISSHYRYGTNAGAPYILTQPESQTNYVGQTASFTVSTGGISPFSYQWRAGLEGSGVYTNLFAGGQFSAPTNAALYISNLTLENAADYVAVVANSYGSVTTTVARLTVLNGQLAIVTPPASQTNETGQTANFTVNAVGIPPLCYQWQAGPTDSSVYTNLIAGGQFSPVTNAALDIANLTLGNAGDYLVVVSNASGAITSSVAALVVLTNQPPPATYDATILADHPASYWPMQETNGPTIHDIISSNNGTMYQGTTPYAPSGTEYYQAWAVNNGSAFGMGGPGILHNVPNDKAIYFTNENATFISVPYNDNLNGAAFTAEAWLHIPNFPINPQFPLPASEALAVLSFLYNGDQPCYGWQLNIEDAEYQDVDAYQAGVMNAWMGMANGQDWWTTSTTQQYNNQWIHAALTYNGTNLLLYIDGTVIATLIEGYGRPSGSETSSTYLLMGAQPAKEPPLLLGWFYQGGMSHVAYYDYALTSSQVTNHYYMGTQGGSLPVQPLPDVSVLPASGGNVTIMWANGFLQQANSVAGPWTDVLPTNRTSPYVIGTSYSAQFFRVSSQP
jgi:hypothetical protein